MRTTPLLPSAEIPLYGGFVMITLTTR
jgi:hypothetical protein